jgi:hypothetical protein
MPTLYKHNVSLTRDEYLYHLADVEFNGITGCWEWTKALSHDGYGRITLWREGKHVYRYAHRLFYEYKRGFKDTTKGLDHLCRNRACVNPWHVAEATNQENLMAAGSRSVSKKNATKVRCDNGHPFTPENTYSVNGKWRQCRECGRIRDRKRNPQRRRQRAMRKLQSQDHGSISAS